MVTRTDYREIVPYMTKDGSMIRELMHPARHGNRNQSVAEAQVPPGARTYLHRHLMAEEIYLVLGGTGLLHLGQEVLSLEEGACILIPPETPHRLQNTGTVPLRVLCACAPAYSHEDTEVLDAGSPH